MNKTHLTYLVMSKGAWSRMQHSSLSFLFFFPSVSRLHQSGPLLWGLRILIPVTVINAAMLLHFSFWRRIYCFRLLDYSFSQPVVSHTIIQTFGDLHCGKKKHCLVPANVFICDLLFKNSCVALCWNFNGCTEKVKVLILVFIILCPKNNGCFLTHYKL